MSEINLRILSLWEKYFRSIKWFSNDFQGARLNDVIKKNDSSFIISIFPENEPINPSPFYAFKAWSRSSKNIFIEFNYPEGYKHRYFPKIFSDGKWLLSDSSSFHELENKRILKLTLNNRPIIISGQELNSSDIDLLVLYVSNFLYLLFSHLKIKYWLIILTSNIRCTTLYLLYKCYVTLEIYYLRISRNHKNT